MTNLVQKTKSQRKTFTIPNYIVKDLEHYASIHDKKQSQIIALALEEFLYKKKDYDVITKRLDALNTLVNIAPKGSLKDLDMKGILKEKAVKDA
jgi:hypothetical protein